MITVTVKVECEKGDRASNRSILNLGVDVPPGFVIEMYEELKLSLCDRCNHPDGCKGFRHVANLSSQVDKQRATM